MYVCVFVSVVACVCFVFDESCVVAWFARVCFCVFDCLFVENVFGRRVCELLCGDVWCCRVCVFVFLRFCARFVAVGLICLMCLWMLLVSYCVMLCGLFVVFAFCFVWACAL